MANLNLPQDVAKKEKKKAIAAPMVAKSYPLSLAVSMSRYGSLINIYPSGLSIKALFFTLPIFCSSHSGPDISWLFCAQYFFYDTSCSLSFCNEEESN